MVQALIEKDEEIAVSLPQSVTKRNTQIITFSLASV
jgi:hypothetical protein